MFSLDQYGAAHESAVTIDRSSQGKIALSGADRASFLHALLTNDIAKLTPGTGVYAAYLTPQGRMISDMRVIETGDRMLLDVEGAVAAPLAARLDALIFSEDAQVEDVSSALAELGVHGPAAAVMIEQATGIPAAALHNQYDNVSRPAAGTVPPALRGVTVVRDDAFAMPGFDVYVAREDAGQLRSRLESAGATPASDETAEVLRVEAGRPKFGVDMNTETIPLEAGIENRAISFTKGCYVGQEVIVRVLHRGHGRVARRLVRLDLSGGGVPSPGDKVLAGEQQVGEITSAVLSPRARSPIALAYVHRDHAEPGSVLAVNGSEARVHQSGN